MARFFRKYGSKRGGYSKKYTRRVSRPIKRYVRRAINSGVESKLNNTVLATAFSSCGSTWNEVELTDIAQGTGQNQRIGNHITACGFTIDGVLVGGQTNLVTDDNRNTMRIILAIWDATTATPCADNSISLSSYLSRDRIVGNGLIQKLFDKVIVLRTPGADSTGYLPAVQHIKRYIRFYRKLYYAGSSSTSCGRKIILSILSDSGAVPNPGFTSGFCNMYFKDA